MDFYDLLSFLVISKVFSRFAGFLKILQNILRKTERDFRVIFHYAKITLTCKFSDTKHQLNFVLSGLYHLWAVNVSRPGRNPHTFDIYIYIKQFDQSLCRGEKSTFASDNA